MRDFDRVAALSTGQTYVERMNSFPVLTSSSNPNGSFSVPHEGTTSGPRHPAANMSPHMIGVGALHSSSASRVADKPSSERLCFPIVSTFQSPVPQAASDRTVLSPGMCTPESRSQNQIPGISPSQSKFSTEMTGTRISRTSSVPTPVGSSVATVSVFNSTTSPSPTLATTSKAHIFSTSFSPQFQPGKADSSFSGSPSPSSFSPPGSVFDASTISVSNIGKALRRTSEYFPLTPPSPEGSTSQMRHRTGSFPTVGSGNSVDTGVHVDNVSSFVPPFPVPLTPEQELMQLRQLERCEQELEMTLVATRRLTQKVKVRCQFCCVSSRILYYHSWFTASLPMCTSVCCKYTFHVHHT